MRAVVVRCHPRDDSLCSAVHAAALAGLDGAGHEWRSLDLYAGGAPAGPRTPPVDDHLGDLRWADTIVLVHPMWWSGQPALMTGWLQDVMDATTDGRLSLRHVRRIAVLTTHGSAKYVNVLEGQSGRHLALRVLRTRCHPHCRAVFIALYDVDRITSAERRDFLAAAQRRMATLDEPRRHALLRRLHLRR